MPVHSSLKHSLFILILTLSSLALAQLTSRPVEPLLETPLDVSDLTSRSATLEITTNTDLACVVVFGTDDGFGQLALDQAMGASAHRDHLVVMRGLEPDTEYRYRLQGSDTSGNFYASEVMSFRTPAAEGTASLGANVATLEKGTTIAEVSSEFSSSFAAQNAIDDDPRTEWSSKGDGNEASITVSLAEPTEVSGFGLWTRTMGSSAQISRFEVENEAGEVFGPFEISDAGGVYTFPAEAQGQTFTFRVVDSSGGNTGVVAVEIYAP